MAVSIMGAPCVASLLHTYVLLSAEGSCHCVFTALEHSSRPLPNPLVPPGTLGRPCQSALQHATNDDPVTEQFVRVIGRVRRGHDLFQSKRKLLSSFRTTGPNSAGVFAKYFRGSVNDSGPKLGKICRSLGKST